MDISLLFIAILSHIIFDFVFQNDFILKMRFPKSKPYINSKLKEKNTLSIKYKLYKYFYFLSNIKKSTVGNTVHSLIHLFGIYLISSIIGLIDGQAIYLPLSQGILISLSHFIIDESKSLLYLKDPKIIKNIWIFLLDQILHLLVILLIISLGNNIDIIAILRDKILLASTEFSLKESILIVFINIFIATFGVGIFIKTLMNHLSSNNNKINSEKGNWAQNNQVIINNNLNNENIGVPNGGFTIGLLERTFILLSIIINYPMMIGFILTIKSVVRFKKLSNDSFAEYFIIGTFLSFIPAILCGVIIKTLI